MCSRSDRLTARLSACPPARPSGRTDPSVRPSVRFLHMRACVHLPSSAKCCTRRKVFVANPNKNDDIKKILLRNKDRLVQYLQVR